MSAPATSTSRKRSPGALDPSVVGSSEKRTKRTDDDRRSSGTTLDSSAILQAIASTYASPFAALVQPAGAQLPSFMPTTFSGIARSECSDDVDIAVDPVLAALGRGSTPAPAPDAQLRARSSKQCAVQPPSMTAAELLRQPVDAATIADARRAHAQDTARNAALPANRARPSKDLTSRDKARNERLQTSVAGLTTADILATKWLEGPQLALLCETTDLTYKTGKFSGAEDTLIRAAVQRHKEEHQLSDEDVISLINKSGKREGAHAEFYADIARMVGQRPVVAVYHHVKRMYAADARKGKWSTAEDAALQTAYAEIGAKWELVSAQVGRAANDCRDRYRNILSKSADREQTLGWTSIEEYELDQAVRSLAAETGVDIISGPQPDLAWGAVSKRLKGKRTRLTCANRWADVTYRLLIGRGELAPWLQYDTYMLISRLHELDYDKEDSVAWARLGTPAWSIWSGANLRRHYYRLKRAEADSRTAQTHREAVAFLYAAHVEFADPMTLRRSKYMNADGLTALPEPARACYGVNARRAAATAAIKTKGKASGGDVNIPGSAKSQQYIDDSDAAAEDTDD